MSIEPLLTVADVARMLNVKPATVYAKVKAGTIPCVRLWTGRRKALIRFRREEIQKMIEEALCCGRE